MSRRVRPPRKRFRGTLEQLDAVMVLAGRTGFWERMPAGYWRFNDTGGAILNWWESRGTINFQGPEQAKGALEHALAEVVKKARQPIPRLTDGRRRQCRG